MSKAPISDRAPARKSGRVVRAIAAVAVIAALGLASCALVAGGLAR